MPGSEYGNIPYEVDEITSWLETWLNDNIPSLVTDALDISAITEAVENGLVGHVHPVLKVIFTSQNIGYKEIVGTWALSNDTSYHSGCVISNTSTGINDSLFVGSFYVPSAGDYTMYLLGVRSGNKGNIHVIVNGSDLATFVMYSVATLDNEYLSESLGELSVGHKAVVLKIADKHASSSDYGCVLQSVMIVRDT